MEVGAGAVEIGEEIVEPKVAAVTRQAGWIEGVVATGLLQPAQIVELADRRRDFLVGEPVALPGEFIGECRHVEGARPQRPGPPGPEREQDRRIRSSQRISVRDEAIARVARGGSCDHLR